MPRAATVLLFAALLASTATASGRGPRPVTTQMPASAQEADLLEECTIGVLSGSVTADGRPILWKNRDTGTAANEVAYFTDGTYPYVTIINAGDVVNAWVGVNEAGFAVLNALSYNLPDSLWGGITNGMLMKLALQTCGTVDEFERLLQQTAWPGRENPANLAVIDAQGGAAIFEVGSHHHRRYDAAGSKSAGYLVRANFSLSADTTGIQTWRFRRADRLVGAAAAKGARRSAILAVSRDLAAQDCDPYPLPFRGAPPGYPAAKGYVDTYETIQRASTVSSGLIHGVRPGEDPRFSTFFVALGKPAVTPFVPVWVAGGQAPPEVDGAYTAPFCDLAQARALDCYDYAGSWRLINTRKLASPLGNRRSHLRLVADIEGAAHARVDSMMAHWRLSGGMPVDVSAEEKAICADMYREYASNGSASERPGIDLRVTPTPTRAAVGIEAVSSGPGTSLPPWIEVFDVSGRQVARLTSGVKSIFTWDGLDASGRPVPAGLYFGRAPGAVRPARILVVR